MKMCNRPVTLLDGDIVRKNLSSELTFSKEHRNLNITPMEAVQEILLYLEEQGYVV